jgi:hypothetical protein
LFIDPIFVKKSTNLLENQQNCLHVNKFPFFVYFQVNVLNSPSLLVCGSFIIGVLLSKNYQQFCWFANKIVDSSTELLINQKICWKSLTFRVFVLKIINFVVLFFLTSDRLLRAPSGHRWVPTEGFEWSWGARSSSREIYRLWQAWL